MMLFCALSAMMLFCALSAMMLFCALSKPGRQRLALVEELRLASETPVASAAEVRRDRPR
eukprot:10882915-Heterocapsa_arctica.AAC.1